MGAPKSGRDSILGWGVSRMRLAPRPLLSALAAGVATALLVAACGGPATSSGTRFPRLDACNLLSAAQVAQIFGSLEPTGDTPAATHQSHDYICVWSAGLTPAQVTSDPAAAAAALEISYYRGGSGYPSAAHKFAQQACNASPQPVPGLGQASDYCGGDLAVVQGSSLVEFRVFSITPAPTAATETSGMRSALARLNS